MLSKLVTSGTTVIKAGPGRFYGATLTTGTFTLNFYNAAATANIATGNEIYRMVHVASQPTLFNSLDGDQNGVYFDTGLCTNLNAGGTAFVLYE